MILNEIILNEMGLKSIKNQFNYLYVHVVIMSVLLLMRSQPTTNIIIIAIPVTVIIVIKHRTIIYTLSQYWQYLLVVCL